METWSLFICHVPPPTTPAQPVKKKNLVQVSILILILTFVLQIPFKKAVNSR